MSSDVGAVQRRCVESLRDFVVYLRLLSDECARALGDNGGDHNAHGWANQSINEFLWGWVAVVRRHLNEADLLLGGQRYLGTWPAGWLPERMDCLAGGRLI